MEAASRLTDTIVNPKPSPVTTVEPAGAGQDRLYPSGIGVGVCVGVGVAVGSGVAVGVAVDVGVGVAVGVEVGAGV